jgi:hypothetical protein
MCLRRARWSPLLISHLLLVLLVRTFVPLGATLEIVVDETLERRWGPHITKCGYYHDPVRSSQKHLRISRGFCVAVSDAPCDASVDKPTLGPPFSQRVADFRGSGYEIGTPTQNGSGVDQTTREADPTMAPRSAHQAHRG